MASTEVERRTKVDTADVPSADWGWSGDAPRVWHVVGIVLGVFLILMSHMSPFRGNHVGRVEDWYCLGFAAAIFFFVGRDLFLRWRGRTH